MFILSTLQIQPESFRGRRALRGELSLQGVEIEFAPLYPIKAIHKPCGQIFGHF